MQYPDNTSGMNHILFECRARLAAAVRELLSFLAGGGECVVCGGRCGAVPVCSSCRSTYFTVPYSSFVRVCPVCGKRLVSEQGVCMQCRRERLLYHTDSVTALFSYRLWNSILLARWKISGERAISPFFASCVASALGKLPCGTVIVPVPPRPGKIRETGWDQVDELCCFLEKRYGYDVSRLLERKSYTEQKTLGRTGRLAAMGGAYGIRQGRALQVELGRYGGMMPEKACIVDDVLTTGATIESCAAALRHAGTALVFALVLFIVD